jgi:hypothetical protein
MAARTGAGAMLAVALVAVLVAGCSAPGAGDQTSLGSGAEGSTQPLRGGAPAEPEAERGSTIWDLFRNDDPPNTTIEVNKYIWNAAQQVLDFMPVEAADPFSGVIVYGFGVPPGGSTAYRAVVYVQDPALDARSLNVALATRSGPASPDTVRAIEDAILTRARQLRLADSRL